MAAKKKQQTHAKRARELAVKERRARKQAKRAERAARARGETVDGSAGAAGDGDTAASEWIR